MRRTLLLFIFSVIICQLHAQVLPKDGRKLNYRLIGFSFPLNDGPTKYKIEISKGICNTDALFKKNKIKTISCKETKTIVEVPSWGEDYTWRYTCVNAESKTVSSELYHFSTLNIPEVDKKLMRLRIVQATEKYKDAYVLLDSNKIMYDMQGNPVWFLPEDLRNLGTVSDMKLSPFGTITMIQMGEAYEINYHGEILWKAPNNWKVSNIKDECYHHEFTRLANGHYMLLRNEYEPWRPSQSLLRSGISLSSYNDRDHHNILFGAIVEYDKIGNLIWSWRSSDYFLESDINFSYPFNSHSDAHARDIIDTHANAFYFDEKTKDIYVGYKIISRILKVSYPEGKVENVYGKIYKSGVPTGQDLFCGQHAISRSKNGDLYLFDNHFCDKNVTCRLLEIKEPSNGDSDMKIVWNYNVSFDDSKITQNEKGGEIMELANNDLFVSMGMGYSKMLIINKNKKILWSAIPEVWNENEKQWKINSQYRASVIENKEELAKMIWNTEEPYIGPSTLHNIDQPSLK